jgi:hypothetical protein
MKRLTVAMFVFGLVWGLEQRWSTGAQTPAEGLIQQNNLTYEGFFKIPTGPCSGNDCSGNYGGMCLAYDSSGNAGQGSLFVCAIAGKQGHIAEISIPGGISSSHTSLSQAPTATRLQGFSNVTNGRLDDINPGDGSLYIGAVMPYQTDKLMVAGVDFFGVPRQNKAMAIVSKNLNSPAFLSGWHAITSNGPVGSTAGCDDVFGGVCFGNLVNGGLAPIPLNWQAALGGDTLAGQCCQTINPLSSAGPSYTSFWSGDLGVKTPVPGNLLLRYEHLRHATLGDRPGKSFAPIRGNPWLYTGNNGGFSVVWPAGSRSVLSFQVVGDGNNYCYGSSVGARSGGFNEEPTGRAIRGSDASTNGNGTVITVPNADLNAFGGHIGHGIWLKEQSSPEIARGSHRYKAAGIIVAQANSGQANASVTVSTPFPANLVDQDYQIGELTCYDPATHRSESPVPSSGHSPTAYPYSYYVLAYDANDLVATKNGAKNIWEPIPYSYWTFTFPLESPVGPAAARVLGAAAYDPDHRKIYLAQKSAGALGETVITVWGVSLPNILPGTPTLCYAAMFAVWTGGSLIRRRRRPAN